MVFRSKNSPPSGDAMPILCERSAEVLAFLRSRGPPAPHLRQKMRGFSLTTKSSTNLNRKIILQKYYYCAPTPVAQNAP